MGTILTMVIALLLGSILQGIFLYGGVRISGENGNLPALMLAALIAGLIGMIPLVGWLISIGVLFHLVQRWTTASGFVDTIFIVIIAWALRMAAVTGLMWLM